MICSGRRQFGLTRRRNEQRVVHGVDERDQLRTTSCAMSLSPVEMSTVVR
jgi:hypothetical protein